MRNHYQFVYAWVSQGESEYFVTSEDYQCQTVVALPTRDKYVFVPKEAERGGGYCWRTMLPSEDGRLLLVECCIWACPFEYHLYDFSRPSLGPRLLVNISATLHPEWYDQDHEEDAVWIDNRRIRLTCGSMEPAVWDVDKLVSLASRAKQSTGA